MGFLFNIYLMRYLQNWRLFLESVNDWQIVRADEDSRNFKPSFKNKNNDTEFYQVLNQNGEVLSEIEVDETNPEILSIYSFSKGQGVGKYLVDYIKSKFKEQGSDSIKVWATTKSRPFWVKMGAVEIDNDDIYRMEIKL